MTLRPSPGRDGKVKLIGHLSPDGALLFFGQVDSMDRCNTSE